MWGAHREKPGREGDFPGRMPTLGEPMRAGKLVVGKKTEMEWTEKQEILEEGRGQ